MAQTPLSVVTGAFGYTGRYIARRIAAAGGRVRTLTNRTPDDADAARSTEIAALDFSRPKALTEAMSGADTLFNTYWIRFPRGPITFERVVANSRVLIDAAARAGVRRIVHVSVTNPSLDSPLPYFRGKAQVERMVAESGLSWAILRPTVVFGLEDILINNIAWLLRRSPVFAIPGAGGYRLQPVFVEDVATLAVEFAARSDNVTADAVGPEVYTFNEMVRLIASGVRARARIVHLPGFAALNVTRIIGWFVRDVVLTREELLGLRADLLLSRGTPTASTSFRRWLTEHGASLGRRYSSELERHYRRVSGPQPPDCRGLGR